MAHLAATVQCFGDKSCQGCEREMKRGEQLNTVEAENGESFWLVCDDCISDWQSGRMVGETTATKSHNHA